MNSVDQPIRVAHSIVDAARMVARAAAARAAEHDHDGGFPAADIEHLRTLGLLAAPIPRDEQGAGLGEEPGASDLCDVLRIIGSGSLALGRLYEGHVNALQLVARYGDASQRTRLFADARGGHLFGVWNTEPADDGLKLVEQPGGYRLRAGKILASGAGFVTRPLVTARTIPGDRAFMVVPELASGTRADLSAWRAHGMRASATGKVDLTGLEIAQDGLLGEADSYSKQPYFFGGAWRFAAVQLGGIEAVLDIWRDHLRRTGRGHDPHQSARLGEGLVATESARLWVERAARIVFEDDLRPERIVAYVHLARTAVEAAGLSVLQLAQRSVGLLGFLRDHPLERASRDLATYLRQPAPDFALTSAAHYVLGETGSAGDLWRDSGDVP
ncbi:MULTISPECIES: acyl-CoA dehydrogenase family protein [Methylobacterium]|uniref:acyl-CoA dehydrogenase family protein n=1 Tax=Methylobacterium TaxID=407 RepID=UPI0011C75C55|nr:MULTISPECIES: acyl-CoA dehydrogenase family protein [Methylobacterium]MBD8903926.1 acyl-CoA dehydrogenase [Methylobacterium bullatum]TXN21525.1 acyl-CoA dehydrogenase [Methylobacterium sp. WL19]